jgi:hypothetical protein
MPEHEDDLPAAPAEDEETAIAAPDVLAVDRAAAMLEPEMLVRGLQQLKERIPEFEQLSIEQRRKMARAAFLDPAFIAAAIHAAGAWTELPPFLRGLDAMRQDDDEVRRWDEAIASFTAILQGMTTANLKRKHRLGRDALAIYRLLGGLLRNPGPNDNHLRPYFEEMKRLYRRNLPKKPRKGSEGEQKE